MKIENIPVLQRITQLYSQMSGSHQMIADLILGCPEEAAFYNIGAMAKRAGVSESTVTRFAVFIGASGFPSMSRELQEIVRSRLSTEERFLLSKELDNDEQRATIHFFEDDVQNIALMIERIDFSIFDRVVSGLLTARKIGISCSRSTISLGLFFEFYLNLLGKEVNLFTGDPRNADLLQRFGPEDIIIGIGFARYSRFTVSCLQYGKKRGAQIFAITDYPSSPLCSYADEILLTPTGIASHMDSFVAPLSLLNALLRTMANRIPDKVSNALRTLEEVWTDFNIYVDPKK